MLPARYDDDDDIYTTLNCLKFNSLLNDLKRVDTM